MVSIPNVQRAIPNLATNLKLKEPNLTAQRQTNKQTTTARTFKNTYNRCTAEDVKCPAISVRSEPSNGPARRPSVLRDGHRAQFKILECQLRSLYKQTAIKERRVLK